MNIYVKTRSYSNSDYKFLPTRDGYIYSENWLDAYTSIWKSEKTGLIFQRNNKLVKVYISAIPSERKDFEKTAIKFTLAFDVNNNDNEDKNKLKIVLKAWLNELYNADEKGEIKTSAIGDFLDSQFSKEYIDKLLSPDNAEPSKLIGINELVEACKKEAELIDRENNNYELKNIYQNHYIINLNSVGDAKNKLEKINCFYSLIENVLDIYSEDKTITVGYFNLISKLKTVTKQISNNNDYPKIICARFDEFNIDEIDDESFELKEYDNIFICLKKKQKKIPQMVANKKEIKTKEQIQTPSKDQQLTKTSTNNIITVVLAVSLVANLILIPLAIHQNKQKTILTENQKIMKMELQKLKKTLEEFKQKDQVLTNEKEILNQEKDQLSNKNTEIQNQQKENQEEKNAQNLSSTMTEK